jgi:hypothetical protein
MIVFIKMTVERKGSKKNPLKKPTTFNGKVKCGGPLIRFIDR